MLSFAAARSRSRQLRQEARSPLPAGEIVVSSAALTDGLLPPNTAAWVRTV